ncbi:hypothetical protein KJ885_05210 [Patescibacteria group bacterium]|nr:hypothetical protein [Patescibacteria group bacterium]
METEIQEPKSLKTISVKIRWWTNGLPEKVGAKKESIPCWNSGVVIIEANKAKGIKSDSEVFHYYEDIPRAITALLGRAKIAMMSDISYEIRAKKRLKKS